ncbi:hypothetical protein CROQUDRAFT_663437 [Cronartium quercuum f. sp. fusiforme G11]|uniref:Uncharacterized protein n=1 Tax=Cronartium quercuum f. sp. fusiforme G11 TaxID=708437 RepID=A0A9P6T7Q1_9BASI|nr:hypothetical protein CROQUDRAFT_663437 [Cronartium quercuum f. sp. fusiforme G11]
MNPERPQMDQHEADEGHSEDQLKQLEQLLLSRFDLKVPNSTITPQTIKQATDNGLQAQEKPTCQVSFKLLSTDNQPQLINIDTDRTVISPEEIPEVIIYPEKSVERKRILDVADEPKEVRKLRWQRIKSLAVNHLAIRSLAQQIPDRPGPRVLCYRTKRIVKSHTKLTIRPSLEATSANVVKDIMPTSTCASTSPIPISTNLASLKAFENELKHKPLDTRVVRGNVTLSKDVKNKSVQSPKSFPSNTQKRKRRRSRQAYRRHQIRVLEEKIDQVPTKLVTMTYL